MGNLVNPRTWVQSDSPSRQELGAVAGAIVNQMGSTGRRAFDVGDRLQSGVVDAMFFLMWPPGLLRPDSQRTPPNDSTAGEARTPAPSPFTAYGDASRARSPVANQGAAQSMGVSVGVPPVFFRRRGVTGISTGSVTDQGNTYVDAAGNVHVSKQIVVGPVWLNHDGFRTEGTETFEINGSLDKNFSGVVYGAFTLGMKEGGGETIIWDGHWAGTLTKKIGQSIMIARGRGPFVGKSLFLNMKEIEPTDEYPDPNVYVLDGYMAEEEHSDPAVSQASGAA
jgi:hypothetical protein